MQTSGGNMTKPGYVVEMKSITRTNEEKQLRLGLGQVLRYRQLLVPAGHRAVDVQVAGRPPPESWQALCDQLGVIQMWLTALDDLWTGKKASASAGMLGVVRQLPTRR